LERNLIFIGFYMASYAHIYLSGQRIVETINQKYEKLGQVILRVTCEQNGALERRDFLDGFDKFAWFYYAVLCPQYLAQTVPLQ
jgi:hypothetical protein